MDLYFFVKRIFIQSDRPKDEIILKCLETCETADKSGKSHIKLETNLQNI